MDGSLFYKTYEDVLYNDYVITVYIAMCCCEVYKT